MPGVLCVGFSFRLNPQETLLNLLDFAFGLEAKMRKTVADLQSLKELKTKSFLSKNLQNEHFLVKNAKKEKDACRY